MTSINQKLLPAHHQLQGGPQQGDTPLVPEYFMLCHL